MRDRLALADTGRRVNGIANKALSVTMQALLGIVATDAASQQLVARFSCSDVRERAGETITLADNGEFRLRDDRIDVFHWESALYRSTHGFDCSIDEEDGVVLTEVRNETDTSFWRVGLADSRKARSQRGFDFDRGLNCAIRIEHSGDMLAIKPTCPALCGSRANFSELTVNLKTGKCHYEE